jgi:hypothetical protein
MTASYRIRFAAITVALAMTAIVHGTMLTGFDNVAQQAIAKQSASANAVALQKVTITLMATQTPPPVATSNSPTPVMG